MANLFRATGHAIALCIALLYILAGQAHFTSRLTPGLAAHVDEMTPRSHQAFWFLNLSYTQIKQLFGMFDLIDAALLLRRSTRKAGLRMAIVGFAGGLYGQLYTGGETGQVGLFFGLACLGTLLWEL